MTNSELLKQVEQVFNAVLRGGHIQTLPDAANLASLFQELRNRLPDEPTMGQ